MLSLSCDQFGPGPLRGASTSQFPSTATMSCSPDCAAVVGGGATALWHWRRARRPQELPAHADRDVNLDIGERVQVAEWAPDGTARVTYRGSGWPARLARGAAAQSGEHDIVAVEGNWLVLAPRKGPGPN